MKRKWYVYDCGCYMGVKHAIMNGAVTEITDEYERDRWVCERMVKLMNNRFGVHGTIAYVDVDETTQGG